MKAKMNSEFPVCCVPVTLTLLSFDFVPRKKCIGFIMKLRRCISQGLQSEFYGIQLSSHTTGHKEGVPSFYTADEAMFSIR